MAYPSLSKSSVVTLLDALHSKLISSRYLRFEFNLSLNSCKIRLVSRQISCYKFAFDLLYFLTRLVSSIFRDNNFACQFG